MEIVEIALDELLVIQPKVFTDSRGYFFESYSFQKFVSLGLDVEFVQDNESYSEFGTIRGLHYQLAPYAQAKLVRVVHGKILDVAVDVRLKSPTYGKYFAVELDADSKRMLFIPRGFAHGFAVLSKSALINYKCDTIYNPQAERGIIYNDPTIGIDWHIEPTKMLVSPKDNVLPFFEHIETNFIYGKQK
jgi:dTDP-4-dehydrorhamnose 3,5-epimerase